MCLTSPVNNSVFVCTDLQILNHITLHCADDELHKSHKGKYPSSDSHLLCPGMDCQTAIYNILGHKWFTCTVVTYGQWSRVNGGPSAFYYLQWLLKKLFKQID